MSPDYDNCDDCKFIITWSKGEAKGVEYDCDLPEDSGRLWRDPDCPKFLHWMAELPDDDHEVGYDASRHYNQEDS
jgi:hypothetical protein